MAEQDKAAESSTAACRVFISHSHDSAEHARRVRALADQLRANGIESWIDQYVQDPDEGWPKWMRDQVKEADKVLLVFTRTYQRRFEGDEEEGKGLGATFEGAIVTQSLYESGGRNRKFRPVALREEDEQFITVELRRFNRYRVDTPEHYQNLLRWWLEAPRITAPTVGRTPDLPPEPGVELFARRPDEPPLSAVTSPPGSEQGTAVRQPTLLGISKSVETVEGVLTFGSGSWRMANSAAWPPGKKMGDAISPPGGYVGGGLQMQVDIDIDPAGNVWVSNNWQNLESVLDRNAESLSTRGGGQGVVVFYGLAKPVRTPLIGPVQQP
jgi:TIR domain